MPLILALALFAPPADYARPELLVEAATLNKERAGSNPAVVLDCRPLAEYSLGHVPGAVFRQRPSGRRRSRPARTRRGGRSGLATSASTPTRASFAYDTSKSLYAAYVWWILHYWGVADVRILNGGYRAWKGEPCPVSAIAARPQAAKFTAHAQQERLADKACVLDSLAAKSLQIVDARSDGEFDGSAPMAGGEARGDPGGQAPGLG